MSVKNKPIKPNNIINTYSIMTINEDKGYKDVLKHIASHELKYITDGLLSGRQSIIDKWISFASNGKTLGPKSISILSNDVDSIVSNIYGFEFN